MNPTLKLITLQDVKPEPVSWLWEPYIPLGKLSIVQGDGGNGKTTLLLAIAAAVSRGDALPGGQRTAPADVIFQSAEDGLCDTIRPKLERFGADCSRIHVIDDSEAALTYGDDRVEQAIVKTGAKLFVFDPFQAYLGGCNMHSANGIRPLMKRLIDAAARTGCAVVILGHLNKRGGAAQYRGLGSVDIFAAARSVLTVGKVSEDTRAVVHSKSNLAPAGASFAIGLDRDGRFVWLGAYDITADELLKGAKKPESQFTKARRLLETALARGPLPAADLMQQAEEQGISPKTLKRAKEALGVLSVKRGVQWFWELPIEAEYTVVSEERQQGHDGQAGHADGGHGGALTLLTPLTFFPEVV